MNRYWRKRHSSAATAPRKRQRKYRALLKQHAKLTQEVAALHNTVKNLEQENYRLEQERRAALQARADDRAAWRRAAQQQLLEYLRKMGEGREFILDALEALSGVGAAKPTRSARSVLEDVKRWIQEIGAARLSRYPHSATVTLHRADLADNLHLYDWGAAEPFSVQKGGRALVKFRVARRGWLLGDEVLHRAVIIEMTDDDGKQ